ncbi:MAG: hypothetical protein SCK29_10920 [Bacillota bacterium]|nr:hypothetical protein [Bacillota bacterium]MDW7684615.1 hypothetical protein [Bacillota bacterium]
MTKIKQQSKQDAYTSNLLISLLMRFPEIMSINFNTENEQAKFTFFLHGCPDKDEYKRFGSLLRESLAAYEELTGEKVQVKPKMIRSGKLNLLEVSCCTAALTLEGIQLITGIVDNAFPDRLMIDADTAEVIHDEEMLRQEEIIEYLLTHSTGTKKENLIAFREAGKVFVYDK